VSVALAWPLLAALALLAADALRGAHGCGPVDGFGAFCAFGTGAFGKGAIGWPIAAALCAAALGTFVCARWFRRRLGGCTGDTLGATQQFSELAMLLAWAAVRHA
jgi:cobalamin synthase